MFKRKKKYELKPDYIRVLSRHYINWNNIVTTFRTDEKVPNIKTVITYLN